MRAFFDDIPALKPEQIPGARAFYKPSPLANRYQKEFYERLCAAGKPKKLALTAVAHKLLIILNAMARNRTSWEPRIAA